MGLRLQAPALLAAATARAVAQSAPEPAAMPCARKGRERYIDPEDGQLDLGSCPENPRGFRPIPIAHDEWMAT
jgi:hypothetical protein